MFAKLDKLNSMKSKTSFDGTCLNHTVINNHKPGKVRRVCHATANYQGVALNDKFLLEPDLLQSLMQFIFCFREHQIAPSADINAMFLQDAVPSDENRCLQFIWREDPEQRIEKSLSRDNKFFGAKSLSACASFALHQVAKDNTKNDRSLLRTVQRNLQMDKFL